MKRYLMPAPALATLLVVVLLPAIAFAQTPTSGALLEIDGTGTSSSIHFKIYDSQIHTGSVLTVPLGAPGNCTPGDQIPTDAYVLQGGSPTGCDPGDPFETSQGTGTATLGQFTITTTYPIWSAGDAICESAGNTGNSGRVCVGNGNTSVDTGFLTVKNNGADFTGTILLHGTSPLGSETVWCSPGGNSSDQFSGTLSGTTSVTLALSIDSSNCGGFNMPISSANLTQPLAAGQTSIFPFGKDDYQITPLNSAADDTLDVLPVPVPAGPLGLNTWGPGNFGSEAPDFSPLRFSAGSNFAPITYACIPYADFSAALNPVCVELRLTPHGSSGGSYLYTATNDFNIDAHSLPGGVGGPSFLGHHQVPCPDSGFDINIFFSYTAPSTTLGDPIKGSGSGTGSCWVAAFDPNAPAIPTGTTFSSFVGFQTPVSDTDLNLIKAGSAVPLIWQQFISPGVGLTNLSLCPGPGVPNSKVCPSTPALIGPWVFVGTIGTACMNDASPNTSTETPVASGASGLQNFGNGTYQYNWKTVKGSSGCVDIVLIYDSGLTLFPAQFKYK